MLPSLLALAAAVPAVLGCAQHDNYRPLPHFGKRQITTNPGRTVTDWAYEASYNWGRINETYRECQVGTQQSPIALNLNQGLSQRHIPSFGGYTNSSGSQNVTGNFYNWGYGPAFTLHHEDGVWDTLPSMTFDNETVYLRGWHIHSPADHTVGGDRSKAELHYVHVDEEGHEAAVLAIRLDPGITSSPFFAQLPPMIGFNETEVMEGVTLNPALALDAVNNFQEFWTYKGSLTSPPCHEGIRFFVARNILFTSVEEMQALLGVSTYSARAEQEVWQHEINV
ncbi:hypothetical protein H2199_008591 [Coniosporium tulheliwenetii]|uniref:Uncharacterized protein n=1 Tax=Coniosporium tulheliwenetii TaxID=3383036 RepID=A0ACC2YIT8_9PEZI|nr:hypothetical protein H2199_008591 [Cladosporium sp. JES 115]